MSRGLGHAYPRTPRRSLAQPGRALAGVAAKPQLRRTPRLLQGNGVTTAGPASKALQMSTHQPTLTEVTGAFLAHYAISIYSLLPTLL